MTGDGSVAVVTAAAGRIGAAVVARLLGDGVVDRVVAVDAVVPGAAGGPPGPVEWIECDLRDPAAVRGLGARLPSRLSVLVNVLGGEQRPPVAPVDDVGWPPPEVWDDIVELNLSCPYRITRELVGRMGPGSAICSVSSIAATMPWAVSPAYGAAKAALEHWSGSLAVQVAERGVRANLVRPGFVWSTQWAAVERSEFDDVVADRVPLAQARDGRLGAEREQTADDVAAAVAFLCSPAASHVTGQAINVDGGAALVRAAR